MARKPQFSRGFTLVELSIVVIIIGFLISGISAGQSLVKQGALNRVISDITQIKTAINAFKAKYEYLPGDFPHAAGFWGSNVNAGGTYNGNGDGVLDNRQTTSTNVLPICVENYAAWRHMSLAKMFPGNFSGTANNLPGPLQPHNTGTFIGIKMPAAPFPNSWYNLWYHANTGINGGSTFYGRQGNGINLNGGTQMWWNSVISAQNAAAIDSKMDDGLADRGMIYTAKGENFLGQNNVCTLGTNNYTNASGSYNLADDSISCRMIFWLQD